MRRILSLVWMSCILMVMTPAYGQKQDKEQSYKHFLTARKLEERGNYEAAAHAYLEAYGFFQSPEFFYNAGRAYELNGSVAEAIEYYQKYIVLAPSGRAADLARAAIARLKPGLASQPEHAQRPGGPVSPENADRSASEQPVPAPEVQGMPPKSTKHDSAQSSDRHGPARVDRGGTVRISGLITGGAGLAALSVGVFFGIEARHLAGDIEGVRGQWTDAALSKFSEGKGAGTRAIVLTGAGTAALIAGGALYVWGARRRGAEARDQMSLAPLISPGSTGLSVAGVF